MFNSPDEVIAFANIYLGFEQCNENPDQMSQVLQLLENQLFLPWPIQFGHQHCRDR